MKKTQKTLLMIGTCGLFCILGWSATYSLFPRVETKVIHKQEAPYVLKDPIAPNRGTYFEFEISEREKRSKTPYSIGPDSITVNMPAFLSQSTMQKEGFFQEAKRVWEYALTINLTDSENLNTDELRKIFSVLGNSKRLNLGFYAYPPNYYELFDLARWTSDPKMELSVNALGPDFPFWFDADSLIIRAKKMAEAQNKEVPLAVFSFGLNQFGNMVFTPMPQAEESLKFFPAKRLLVHGINIRPYGERNGIPTTWKAKVEAFFKESPIEEMWVMAVGAKKNGKITLSGF